MNLKKTNEFIKGINSINSGPDTEDTHKLMREKNILYFIREITKALVSARSIEEMSKMVYTFLKDRYGESTIGLAVNSPKEKKVSNCFFFEKDLIGAFTFQIYEKDAFSIKELDICRELLSFMIIALNNTIQNKKVLMANKILEKYSKYDDLTGIYNRRFFYESFDKIYKESILENKKVFLYLMDLDNFKGVNNNFGHFVGDEFLCGVANVSKKIVIELAEKIIDEIDKLDIYYNNLGQKVSISIGILELSSKKDLRDYFLQLDENLYKAKNSTRTKIFIS